MDGAIGNDAYAEDPAVARQQGVGQRQAMQSAEAGAPPAPVVDIVEDLKVARSTDGIRLIPL